MPESNVGKIYLKVPFREKDKAKALGARWDPKEKLWYAPDILPKERFARWLPPQDMLSLTDEQKALIECVKAGKNVLVDACIGSGKTTSIQVLCSVMEKKRILYLTYNRLLKLEAKAKIPPRAGLTVTNYHGWAFLELKKVGVHAGQSSLIQTFLEEKPPIPEPYELLLLDEYQDIDQEIADMLQYIKDSCPGLQIVAVGDMAQKIYDMTTLDVTKWIHRFLGQYESLKLTCCFRLPEEYARHVGELWGKSIVGVNPDCRVVEMTSPEALHYLSEQKPGDVLCLGERGTMLAMFLNELERLYPERYNKNTVYASIRNEDRTMQPNLEKAAIFTSYDSSKGMERPVCVVLNWTETYWNKRVQKPMTRREIMRNVFLVAASRGKRDIIFALDEGDQRLTDESLTGHAPGVRVFREPFDIGTMFEYRFAEDIERCYRLLDVQQLCGPELEDLDIPLRDGFIDLSPCIGIYQRAAFFRNIDVDMLIWQYVQEHPDTIDITIPPGADLETKILVLAGYVTQYRRYVEQVEVPYVTGEQEDRLKERLGMLFTGDEEVDGYCEIRFLDQVNEECIIRGHMDVEKDGAVYDLRYVSELSHESYLELACYLLGSGHETGVLCNMRNGEMWQVKVPDKEKFLTQVVRTITKGAVQEYVEPPEVPDDADVPATDLKEILRQISQDDPGDSVPSWDMVSAPPGGDDLDEVF